MSIYLCSAARRTTTTTTTTTQPLLLVVPTTAFFPISPPSRLLPRSPPAAYYSSASSSSYNPRGVLHSSSSFYSLLTAQKKNIYPPRGILPLRVQGRFNSTITTITDTTTSDMSSSAKKEFLVIIPDKPGVGAKRIEVRPWVCLFFFFLLFFCFFSCCGILSQFVLLELCSMLYCFQGDSSGVIHIRTL